MNAFSLLYYFFLFLVAFSNKGVAAIGYQDSVFPEVIHSGRALAMGNAFVARVDDESAPFYNPAGLGSFRKWRLHLSNIFFEGSGDFFNKLNDGIEDSYDIFRGSFSTDRMRKLHRDKPGYVTHNRYSLAPNFTTRYLSFGYLYSRRLLTYYGGEDTGDRYEVRDRKDYGPYMGMNLSFGRGTLKLGATLALLSRREVTGQSNINEKFSVSGNSGIEERKGMMVLAIAGLRYTYPAFGLPTFALVFHNPLKTKFSKSNDNFEVPSEIKQNIIYGVSVTPFLTYMTKIHLEINYKDAKKRYPGLKDFHRFSFGAEFNYRRTIYARLGVNHGMLSAGIGASVNNYKLDLTTYAEPKDLDNFPDEEDRRFVLSASFNI